MANPTTNRPARAVFDSGLGFGSTAKAVISCDTLSGPPIELINKTSARRWEGPNGAGSGYSARCKATGFPHTPTASPSIKWGYGSPSLIWPGRAFVTGDGNVRTFACVMKLDYKHPPGVSNNYWIPILNGFPRLTSSFGGGFGVVSTNSSGMILRGHGTNSNTSGLTVGNLTLDVGVWYAVAFSCDMSGGSGAYKYKFQLYNYATQVESTAAEITNSTVVTNLTTGADVIVGYDRGTACFPFRGEMAQILLDKQYWSQANFQSYYADPWQTERGTYSTAGSLTAPTDGSFIHGEGGITYSFPHATGTGTSGTGTPTYYFQRYTNPNDSPSTGARVGGAIAADAGGACVNVTDATAEVGEVYWCRLEVVDGSDTVYYPASGSLPIIGQARTSGTPKLLVFCGDSRVEGEYPLNVSSQIISKLIDRPVCSFNRAKSGLFSYNWTNGVNAVGTAGVTGTPTSGTFVLGCYLSGGSAINFRNVPYDCSAALLKTILEDNSGTYTLGVPNGSNTAGIGGSGNVTTSGGPLNVAPITVTFDGPTSQKKSLSQWASTSNGFDTGAPSIAISISGAVQDTTYFTPMLSEIAAVLAEDADITASDVWVVLTIGTNDMNNSTPTNTTNFSSYLQSAATRLTELGYKFAIMAPPIIRPTATNSGSANHVYTGRQYATQISALTDGTNVFALGNSVQSMAIRDQYGSSDGLHGTGNELFTERYLTAAALVARMFPATFGDSVNILLLGVG